MFLLVSGGHTLYPLKGHYHGVSIKSLINLGKTFFEYLAYQLSHWPDSWRGFLYIYLLLFPRFWTFCIDWFAFLFLMAWQWKHRIEFCPWVSEDGFLTSSETQGQIVGARESLNGQKNMARRLSLAPTFCPCVSEDGLKWSSDKRSGYEIFAKNPIMHFIFILSRLVVVLGNMSLTR